MCEECQGIDTEYTEGYLAGQQAERERIIKLLEEVSEKYYGELTQSEAIDYAVILIKGENK